MTQSQQLAGHEVVIEIGGIAIALHTLDLEFVKVLHARYGVYVNPAAKPDFSFDVDLVAPNAFIDPEADAQVWMEGSEWRMERGDFRASWDPEKRHGLIHQTVNPFSIDSVLRIVHTILLARTGGFLLHASSAVRNGKAFLFSGLSEAGKTTISRLAPSDAALLTDEASYVRKIDGKYMAYGTPFAGELGVAGENIAAPIAAVYLLAKSPENRIDPIEPSIAIRRLMRNVLFFAQDPSLVGLVFESVCTFVATVPVFQLSFYPDQRVWELIG